MPASFCVATRNNGGVKELARVDNDPLIARVSALITVLQGSTLGELDLTEQGTHILIRRKPGLVVTSASSPTPTASGVQGAMADEGTLVVRAPLAGVFYVAPAPGAPPFVTVGSLVQVNQVVAIIEAMKVLNEIRSEVSGRVKAVLASDGQLVQKDDPLFLLI
jgi:acetyl-CoA carboxylase biotin carboxyl carrier protein